MKLFCRAAVGAGLLVAVVAAVTPSVHAESVSVILDSNQPATPGLTDDLNLTFVGSGGTAANYNGNAFVGRLNWVVTADDTSGGVFKQNQTFHSYCIQGLQEIDTGTSYTYTLVPLAAGGKVPVGSSDEGYLDSTAATQIQGLYNLFSPYLDKTSTIGGASYSADIVDAAFQLDIWEIEYDGGAGGELFGNPASSYFSNTAGSHFYASGLDSDATSALALATWGLNNFTAAPSTNFLALTNGDAQDQLYIRAVPLPAALPVGAAMLAGLFSVRFFRKRAR